MSTLINQAIAIAKQAHANQWRRDGITPYIMHPRAVAERLKGEQDPIIATAWLHDVLEDTMMSPALLHEACIPNSIIESVITLTRKDNYDWSYMDYLALVKANPIALKVKIADILCNLADHPAEKQIKKYANALVFLMS
jgi:(p)ppGpp synthase/HD superfamily hydrolase